VFLLLLKHPHTKINMMYFSLAFLGNQTVTLLEF